MSITEFVEMTVFLCLICFSIYDKMQGFLDESGLFIFLFIFFLCVCVLCRNSKWPPKVVGKRFLGKIASSPADTLWVKNFVKIARSRSISEINRFLRLMQKFKMTPKNQIPCGSTISSKSLYLAPFPR